MKTSSFIATFLTGALFGVAAGVLFAPEKGEETRRRLASQGSKLADQVRESFKKRGINISADDLDDLVDDIAENLESAD